MGSTSLDSRVLSSAELRVSGESMEKGVITADVATHEEVTELRELFAGERFGEEICSIQVVPIWNTLRGVSDFQFKLLPAVW